MVKQHFDPVALALTTYRGPDYNYHTRIRNAEVHMIRESLYYALMLLDRDQEGDADMASRMIERMITYQDMDTANATFGIWPYYMEEQISEMLAPDWNWADFCGKALIQALVVYGDVIDSELQRKIKLSIEAAAISIMRRDVKPAYTNICIMGTYVALVAGELLASDSLYQYGRDRLRRFHQYCSFHGAFTEYNSPTYTIVAIEDLALMLKHVRDEASLAIIEELYEMAWATVAEHYHAPTGQWAGPHSRAYETLQGDGLLSLLHFSSAGQVPFPNSNEPHVDPLWNRAGLHIPQQFVPCLNVIGADRYTEKTILKEKPELRASSLMTQYFSLGTFNHCDFWNQRRPLLAYWGNPGQASYMRLRFIHDGYDFSSGLLHTVQHRGQVLGIANLCTDHGDKHFKLDPINGAVNASYLGLWFEFGGALDDLEVSGPIQAGETIIARAKNTVIGIQIKGAKFGHYEPKLVLMDRNGCLCLEVILYEGELAELNLADISDTYIAFGLTIDHSDISDSMLATKLSDIEFADDKDRGIATMSWQDECISLHLEAPTSVQSYLTSMDQVHERKHYGAVGDSLMWTV